MVHCASCKAEVPFSVKSCPACGTSVPLVSNGTQATVAIDVGPVVSSRSVSRISEVSSADDGRFLPGTLLNGRYRVVGLLGRGGMGEVYRATDLTLAQSVALKFLPEAGVTERVLERFHAEVRIARQVSHPNICRVYDIGEVDGQPFISMEYVDGEDLGGLLQRIGRLPNDKALDTARKICAGLAAAHDRGIIHRDLKPANIMLNKRGEPVIMDFGLAAVADQLTGAEARNGTPAYMSPEQLRGEEVTPKSDIYALGLVLYEIFTGKRAYEAQSEAELVRMQESAQFNSLTSVAADVDPQVEKVIRRCLMPSPAQRPVNALAVAAALPGGDPLAAALAAGETPSPEMVAASGKTEGMDLKYSLPLLVFIVGVLFAAPIFFSQENMLENTPRSISREVAAHEARKIAASFGYTETPADTYLDVADGSPESEYWKKHDRKGRTFAQLNAAEPFVSYMYRESPTPMVADPSGQMSASNPPMNVAGMIHLRLTIDGRLREWEAISPTKMVETTASVPFQEEGVFKAVGYDRKDFSETVPEAVPPYSYDSRKAWKGSVPELPGVDIRVEAATLNGKLTGLRVIYPWSTPRREPQKPPRGISLFGPIGLMVVVVIFLTFTVTLAVRNLRLNRADRQGALRLAIVSGALGAVGWVGYSHHVADLDEWTLMANTLSEMLFKGFFVWLIYVALEPAIRSRWPHALVTWNRALVGQFGDAQVGVHILVGAAVGMVITVGSLVVIGMEFHRSGALSANDWNGVGSAREWVGTQAAILQNAIRSGLVIFFAIFGFRRLLRNDYLAAIVVAIVGTIIEGSGIWTRQNPWVEGVLYIVIYGLLTLILIRLGLVAAVSAIVFNNSLSKVALGPGLNHWYTPYGLATMAFLISIAFYSFWRSMGSRGLGDPDS